MILSLLLRDNVSPLTQIWIVFLLGVLNSTLISRLLNTYSGQHKYSGYINLLPIPNVEPENEIRKSIIDKVKEIVFIKENYYAEDETTLYFNSPYLANVNKDALTAVNFFISKLSECENNLVSLHSEVDDLVTKYYGINDTVSLEDLNTYAEQTPKEGVYKWSQLTKEEIRTNLANDFLSYCVGLAFGRWGTDAPKSTPVNVCIGGVIFYKDLSELARFQSQRINKSEVYDFSIGCLKLDKIEKYVGNNKLFFDYHLQRYTCSGRTSPLYWPLQVLSGSYTLWVYYHKITEQTLFICVNNFVDPELVSVNDDLVALKNKTSRNKDEEKEFGRLSDLKLELEDFRDELLRIAKFWKPDLNDGVQITAAPLWRLFQHKPWQKKLKQTWEKLEAGEYDWAHLACSIWPTRVLKKCHQDRSLAIAHEVENDLWHEVEVIKPRKKEPVLEWQPKSLSDTELNAYIQNKIQIEGLGE
ncbi:hypothetical protein BHECKSOX_2127 [Bathymodiolus heckerae thiotrophic gill symbiont]|nr:hypothetical protein BHECKSOX_2127 [Bathymodiolus heckerae thiotrophic gill symbiont]